MEVQAACSTEIHSRPGAPGPPFSFRLDAFCKLGPFAGPEMDHNSKRSCRIEGFDTLLRCSWLNPTYAWATRPFADKRYTRLPAQRAMPTPATSPCRSYKRRSATIPTARQRSAGSVFCVQVCRIDLDWTQTGTFLPFGSALGGRSGQYQIGSDRRCDPPPFCIMLHAEYPIQGDEIPSSRLCRLRERSSGSRQHHMTRLVPWQLTIFRISRR